MASSRCPNLNLFLQRCVMGMAIATPTLHALEVGPPVLESVNIFGAPVNGAALAPRLSSNGRYLAFTSRAANLVPGLWTNYQHVYLRDRQAGITRRLSIDDFGNQYPYDSTNPNPSSDGRAVFNSSAPLIPEFSWMPPNLGRFLAYLRDTNAGTTTLIARRSDGSPAGSASVQGNVNFPRSEVVLHIMGSLTGGAIPISSNQAYVRNWASAGIELISAKPNGDVTDGTVSRGTISPSGRFVVFYSAATDLTNDNPLGQTQLFLRDRVTHTTRRITFPWNGGDFTSPFLLFGLLQFPDDNTLVFDSPSRELTSNGASLPPSNVFQLKLDTGVVTVASVGVGGLIPNGQSSNGHVSADGRFVAFTSRATNLTQPPLPDGVYVRDRLSDEIVNVSASLGPLAPNTIPNVALSADGSVLSFDWWHPSSVPVVGGRVLIYSVSVRGSVPFVAPVPVPTRSLAAITALIGLLGVASFLRQLRTLSI